MGAHDLSDTLPGRAVRRTAPRLTVLPVPADGAESPELHGPRLRYEEERVLGEGGMGKVWLTRDNDIGRRVALKRLRGDAGHGSFDRFVDEVRIAGRLEHPNIPPVHDVGVDESGSPFFVMKLVEGEGLDRVLARLRRGEPATLDAWPIERRVEVVRGVLSALSYAHGLGLVHRDVKPANVMIGNSGEIVLTDWGVARSLDGAPATDDRILRSAATTRDGQIVGTPLYMAPEQAGAWGDEKLDGRVDVYAAGVMLHELITLRHYMEGVGGTAELIARLHDPRSPGMHELAKKGPAGDRVPAELIHVARRAMQRNPAHRYQSARDMLDALDAVREGRMAVECHVTLTKRGLLGLSRWIDRSPMVGPAAIWMGVLGLVASGGWAVWALLGGAM